MRVAVCLYGIVGGKGGKDGKGGNIPFEECYETQQKHIIGINNADVFIHSWSQDVEKEIIDLYKPKKCKFQEQIKFKYNAGAQKQRDEGYRSLSRWYSTMESIKLKQDYEKENNFKYDCVMLMRFDILFFVDFNFSKYDLKYLYASNWNTPQGLPKRPYIKADRVNRSLTRPGFLDLWFFSNSKIMDEFAKVYNGVEKREYVMFQHKSAWDHLIKNGYTKKDFKYIFYRHFDFEVYRWHHGFYETYRETF